MLLVILGCQPNNELIPSNGKNKIVVNEINISIKGYVHPVIAFYEVTIENKRNHAIYVNYEDFLLKIIKSKINPEINVNKFLLTCKPSHKENLLKDTILEPFEKIEGVVCFADHSAKKRYFFEPGDELLFIIKGLRDVVTNEEVYLEKKFKVGGLKVF
jgi:hypothetical protein